MTRSRAARASIVAFALTAMFAVAGCWTDPGSMDACAKLCNGRVKSISSKGCVCASDVDGGSR